MGHSPATFGGYGTTFTCIVIVYCRLYLCYHMTQWQVTCSQLFHKLSEHSSSFSNSLLQLSVLSRSDATAVASHYHPSVIYLSTLVTSLISEMSNYAASVTHISDAKLLQILGRHNWLVRFVDLLCLSVDQTPKQGWIAELALHWNWLNTKFLFFLQETGIKFSNHLQETIRRLQSELGVDDRVSKAHEALLSSVGRAAPFRNIEEMQAYSAVERASKELTPDLQSVEQTTLERALCQKANSVKIKIIHSFAGITVEPNLNEVVIKCSSLQLLVNDCVKKDVSKELTSAITSHLDLSPLFEYLALCQESVLATTVCTGQIGPLYSHSVHHLSRSIRYPDFWSSNSAVSALRQIYCHWFLWQ